MKGFRTLAFNGLVVIGGAALTWAAGINWTEHLSPTAALIMAGVVNIGLRLVTSGPVGGKP